MIFKSEDYEDHSKSFSLRFWVDRGGFCNAFWIVVLLYKPAFFFFSFLTECVTFAFRICWDVIESILQSTHSVFSVPWTATHPKTIIDHRPLYASFFVDPLVIVAKYIYFYFISTLHKDLALISTVPLSLMSYQTVEIGSCKCLDVL